MNFIDTHCHLNDEKFSADLNEVVKRAKNIGVNRIIPRRLSSLPKSLTVCMRASAFTLKKLKTSMKINRLKKSLNLPPTKKLWQSAKSDLIIIGKKIPTFDLLNKKFLFDSWILRGS